MDHIIAEYSDRDLKVSVLAKPFVADWTLYGVILSGDGEIRLGQYELMSLVRMLYQAYEVIQKEEAKEVSATV